MSDIYLQITETPTVVTLSAPVVSGALASTVTVANTVTVALDSNSLSALENVTVTVGAAITGTVTVSNFPATQPVSIASVTIGNTVTIAGTVTANNSTLTNVLQYDGSHYFLKVGGVATTGGTSFPVYVAGTVTANPTGTQTIAGTVTANAGANVATAFYDGIAKWANGPGGDGSLPIYVGISSGQTLGGLQDGDGTTFGIDRNFPVDIISALPAGTNRIGVVTIGGGTVTIGAGTAQIGSVTASISNSVTIASLPAISGTVTANTAYATSVTGTARGGVVTAMPVALVDSGVYGGSIMYYDGSNTSLNINVKGSLPSLAAGTAQIGSVTASISNSVTIGSLPAISGTVTANTFALQGTAVTTSNFTSTTASTVLAGYNATREVLTLFNEGAGNLHICAGATCTTIAYQVRLSAGDYYEVPNHQTTITHSAVFATAGTARVTEVS